MIKNDSRLRRKAKCIRIESREAGTWGMRENENSEWYEDLPVMALLDYSARTGARHRTAGVTRARGFFVSISTCFISACSNLNERFSFECLIFLYEKHRQFYIIIIH